MVEGEGSIQLEIGESTQMNNNPAFKAGLLLLCFYNEGLDHREAWGYTHYPPSALSYRQRLETERSQMFPKRRPSGLSG